MGMLRVISLFVVLLVSACAPTDEPGTDAGSAQQGTRPNILLIMADDLGYADIGAHGSEIRTPNIDQLAETSVSFRQFYAAPLCSPSRAMALTGTDNHINGFGTLGEHLAENQKGQPGYEGYLNDNVVTFPTMLRDAGYRTYMAGKWHLGGQEGALPHERGFEHSFALITAGASHFADMRTLISLYPATIYLEDGNRVTELPGDFYSSEFFTDKIIQYIEADRTEERPFFAWLAFTAPHWPLQVRDEHLDDYAGAYDEGYDSIQQARLARAEELGTIPPGTQPVPRVPLAEAWNDLSTDEKRYSSRSMEVYAAMVERMDVHIGRMIDYLRDTGQYDNTVIIFMSDNGAEGNDRMQLFDNETWVPANFDLSYENIGRPNSYTMQGAGWGQVSTGVFRFFKGFVTEGGLRVPFFLRWPGMDGGGSSNDAVVTINDLAPTILDFAGVSDHNGEYRGRSVQQIQGRSFRPLLDGQADQLYASDEPLGWEINDHRAIRKGDWKILWANGQNGSDGWQLFNIAADPREVDDLSAQFPEKLAELVEDWEKYAAANGVISPIGDTHGLN